MEILEPIMMFKITHPKIVEKIERDVELKDNLRLSEVLSAEFNEEEGKVNIHLAPATELIKDEGIGNFKKEVEVGLKKLAEILLSNDKIKEVWATSWIVAKNPTLVKRLGFIPVGNIVAILILLEVITFLLPTLSHLNTTGGMTAEVISAVLADLTNGERQTQNLPILTVSPLLNEAAEMKATDMATKGYFAHTSPEGKTPWYWLEQAGYNYQYAGENLAINFSDSKDVTIDSDASSTKMLAGHSSASTSQEWIINIFIYFGRVWY